MSNTHVCGGTILSGGSGEQSHIYCDRCHAFSYDTEGDLPDGTDEAANRAAWDAGESESPSGSTVYMICDGDGNAITDGVQQHEIAGMAQRIADERGETVYVGDEAYSPTLPVVDVRDLPGDLSFLTPPRNLGQMVLVSYAGLYDGRALRKTYDQSDRSTAYAVGDLSADEIESGDIIGLNDEPGIEGDWQPCEIRE
jgi:hypothetical protein